MNVIKLTGSYGEIFVDCIIRLLYLAENLDSAGRFEPNMLCNVVNIL